MNNSLIKTILITGASSGVCAALALEHAAPSTNLHLAGRNKEALEKIADDCRRRGAKAQIRLIDVTHREAMADWIAGAEKQSPIDIIYANAGISGGTAGSSELRDYNLDREIFDVNLTGVLNTIYPALPAMIERKSGHIAIISSVASLAPLPGAPAYSASKAAVRFYGEALATKLRRSGVQISVVCPGFIKTRMTDCNDFNMPFIMDAAKAAKIIRSGVEKGKIRIDFPWPMLLGVKLIALLPQFFTRDIFAHLPEKSSRR